MMCNPSKKTIKRIVRMLESRCKKDEAFEIGKYKSVTARVFTFKKPVETGFQKAIAFVPTQSIMGFSLDESGEYKYFKICSPEQLKEILI